MSADEDEELDELEGIPGSAEGEVGIAKYLGIIRACALGCGGKGFYLRPDGDALQIVDCACRTQAVLEYRLDQANVGERFHDFEWARLTPEFLTLNQPEIAAIQRFADTLPERVESGHGLYLSGPNGVAKTAMTSLVIRQACALGIGAYQTTLGQLIEMRLDGMSDRASRQRLRWVLSNKIRVLAVEEVDKVAIVMSASNSGRLRHSAISEIMDSIYYHRRTLVVTSNMPLRSVLSPSVPGLDTIEDFPSHIIDRMDSLTPLTLKGSSFRSRERWVP